MTGVSAGQETGSGPPMFVIRADGPDGRVDHFYADTDLQELEVVSREQYDLLRSKRDHLHRIVQSVRSKTALDVVVEKMEAEDRARELEKRLAEYEGKMQSGYSFCHPEDDCAGLSAWMRGSAVRYAAEWLLRLKDGPRDETYEREKPQAWQALREALAGVREGCPLAKEEEDSPSFGSVSAHREGP